MNRLWHRQMARGLLLAARAEGREIEDFYEYAAHGFLAQATDFAAQGLHYRDAERLLAAAEEAYNRGELGRASNLRFEAKQIAQKIR